MALPDSADSPFLRVLPRGPHGLARDVVEASQRARLLDAMAQAVAEKGYGAVSVADVIARAGVSRKTFYEHFRDKLDCFLAAYEVGVEVLLGTVHTADGGGGDVLAVTRARIRAYLETLAAEPAFARTFLIEVNAAGPAAIERRRAVHRQFAVLARELVESVPGAPRLPDELYLAAVGATNEVVSAWVVEGRTAQLPELEDVVFHIQVSLLSRPFARG
ncbi:MAG TPA: TetR/AcrR family transcriptional regulator [Solirubrobacteraceae bacterium]